MQRRPLESPFGAERAGDPMGPLAFGGAGASSVAAAPMIAPGPGPEDATGVLRASMAPEEAVTLNEEGMAFLRARDIAGASERLGRAEAMLQSTDGVATADARDPTLPGRRHAALALTAGNLGCLHKRLGDYASAVGYLSYALRLHEEAGADGRTLAGAHLNLYGCLATEGSPSQQESALRHASAAVELLGRVVASAELQAPSTAVQGTPAGVGGDGRGSGEEVEDDVGPSGLRLEDYASLAIAYHNVACAKESLRDWSGAALAYTQAYEVAVRSLGADHSLTKAFEQSVRCPGGRPQLGCAEAPLTWRSSSRTTALPNIPTLRWSRGRHGAAMARASPRLTGASLAKRYALPEDAFPQWPPKTSTKEELAWYAYAERRLKGPANGRLLHTRS